MSLQSMVVTIPNLQLSLDQLLAVIRQLDEPARVRIARTLLETRMDEQLANLIEQLAHTPSVEDISDSDIEAEIRAVRQLQG